MPKIKTLSPNFVHCSRDDLIILIARMLNSLISINDNFNNDSNLSSANLTRFHSRTPPAISIYSYLARLARYSSLENAVLLTAVYYIDLLSTVYNSFTLNSLTVHRFLLTATTVGSKGLCDSFCTNSHYAKVGGIQVNELDILEREFLIKVNYRILPRDFNIENCANDNKIGSASERKKSIDQLEDGGIRSEFDINNENKKDNSSTYTDRNSGYNVLELYYRKMIALVGKEVETDDDQLPESYRYEIEPIDKTRSEIQNNEYELKNLIKTDPDTLPDEIYHDMINNLMLAYRKHLGNLKKKQHPQVSQCKNNEVKVDPQKSVTLPKSPLKRSIDHDPQVVPSGKRTANS